MSRTVQFTNARFIYTPGSTETYKGLLHFLNCTLDQNEYELKGRTGEVSSLLVIGHYGVSKILDHIRYFTGLELTYIGIQDIKHGQKAFDIPIVKNIFKACFPRAKQTGQGGNSGYWLVVGAEKSEYRFTVRSTQGQEEINVELRKGLARHCQATILELKHGEDLAFRLYASIINSLIAPESIVYFEVASYTGKLVRAGKAESKEPVKLEDKISSFLLELSAKHGADRVKEALKLVLDKDTSNLV